MCLFITAVLPRTVRRDALTEVLDRYNFPFTPLANEFVRRQLRPGEGYFRVTGRHCDCDSVLGSHARRLRSSPAAAKPRSEKKGWSAAKVARRLRDAEKTERKRTARNDLYRDSRLPEAGWWLSFLKDGLAGEVGWIGLLLHFGGPDDRIALADRARVSLGEIPTGFMLEMREDVLYEFME